ncbi:hypothetical protein H9P43_007966 [Blastocladiella emersonii ATCC 22665]|nr:hypothetical protein H9P43_007966 [Blastocladiella emersonii ATCC 22665]
MSNESLHASTDALAASTTTAVVPTDDGDLVAPGSVSATSTAPHVTAPAADVGPVHLLVISHGLYGKPDHTGYLAKRFAEAYPDIAVLNCSSYSTELTLDGVDACGERMLTEIEEFEATRPVKQISFLGYSLGGLIIRYTIGRLHQRGYFDRVEPMNAITMATPHLGVSGRPAYIANLILYRSGSHCTLTDTDYGAPLLWVLSDPTLPFIQGLKRFKHVLFVANAVGDRTVPFLSASARTADPYHGTVHEPVDPLVPEIVRPAAEAPPRTFLGTAGETVGAAARTGAFVVLLLPVFTLVWIFLAPYGYYQSRRAHDRFTRGAGGGGVGGGIASKVQPVVDSVRRSSVSPTPTTKLGLVGQDSLSELGHGMPEAEAVEAVVRAETAETAATGVTPDEYRARIVDALDAELPGLRRIDAHLGEWRHTHAFIVVRNPAVHMAGAPVVEYVVREFVR